MLSLKNWFLEETIHGHLFFFARGDKFGHYRLADGDFVHTSNVVKIYLLKADTYIHFRNLFWQLIPDKCERYE